MDGEGGWEGGLVVGKGRCGLKVDVSDGWQE